MTDHLDNLLRERFAAQHDSLPAPDLGDVHARLSRIGTSAPEATSKAARSRRLRSPVMLAATLAAAAVVSAAAYAFVRLVIVGSPAPPPVRASEQVLEQVKNSLFALKTTTARQIQVSKTRDEAVLTTSSGPVYLWVAPTLDGDRCMYLQITGLDLRFAGGSPFLMAAGCVVRGQPQSRLFRVNTGVNGHTLPLVAGYLAAPATSLQLRFSDGTTSKRYGANDGFVLALGSRYDPNPSAIAYDKSGKRLPSNAVRYIGQLFVSTSPTGVLRFTITIPLADHKGTLALKIGPAGHGGSCRQLNIMHGKFGGMAIRECGGREPSPNAIDIHPGSMTGVQYLQGDVGKDITSLELLLGDGSQEPLPLHHHWALYQIDPNDPPVEIIAHDKTGTVVATRHITSGTCLNPRCKAKVKILKLPGVKVS